MRASARVSARRRPMATDMHARIAELERQLAARDAQLVERDNNLAALVREREAGRERERAVAEVMRLLGTSPDDTRAVFAAVLQAIPRVQGRGGTLWLRDGEMLRHWGTVSVRVPVPPF